MHHPNYLSHDQKVLRTLYLNILSAAPISAEQSRWIVTGTAVLLGIIVGNIDKVKDTVGAGVLQIGMILLTVSVLLGVGNMLLAVSINAAIAVGDKLYSDLAEPDTKSSLEAMSITPEAFREQMIKPFWGPFKRLIERNAKAGGQDFLRTEKLAINAVCWLVYSGLTQGLFGLAGLTTLIFGIK